MLTLGQRVWVKGNPGIVRYMGETKFAPGKWIGVELDSANGKNDGSVAGHKYFDCKPLHGVFARQSLVSVMVEQISKSSKDSCELIASLKSQINALQLQISSLEAKAEMVAIDKDYFQQTNEELSNKIALLSQQNASLEQELALLREEHDLNKQIEDEIHLQVANGSLVSLDAQDSKLLVQKNKKLETALLNLQHLFDELKLSHMEEISKLTKETINKSTFEELKLKLGQSEALVSDLQNQLESMNDIDNLVESLTLENDELKSKIDSLEATINDLTELTELDKSLEENHKEIENNLRLEIDKLMKIIKKDQLQIQTLNDQNASIEQSLSILQNTNDPQLQRKLDTISLQLKNAKLNCKSLNLQIKANLIEFENVKFFLQFLQSKNFKYLNEISLVFNIKLLISKILFLQTNIQLDDNEMITRSRILSRLVILLEGLQWNWETYYREKLSYEFWNEAISNLLKKIDYCIGNLIQGNFFLDEFDSIQIHQHILKLLNDLDMDGIFLQTYARLIKLQLDDYEGISNSIKDRLISQIPLPLLNDPLKPLVYTEKHEMVSIYEKLVETPVLNSEMDISKLLQQINWDYQESVVQTESIYNETLLLHETIQQDSQDEVQLLTSQLNGKEIKIQELEQNIEFLKNNLSLIQTKNDNTIAEFRQQISSLEKSQAHITQKYQQLVEDNEILQREIEDLMQSNKEYQEGKTGFDDIFKEKENVEKLELISEIRLLRNMVNERNRMHDIDYSWLKEPIYNFKDKLKYELPWSKEIEASTRLRKLARAPYVTIGEGWREMHKTPKYITSKLKEQKEAYRQCI